MRRTLKEGTKAVIKKDSYPIPPPIFTLLAKKGQIEEQMMYNTYNMGIGMIVAVDPADVETAMEAMRKAGDTPYVIGSIEVGEKGVELRRKSRKRASGGGTNLQVIIEAIGNGLITKYGDSVR